MAKAYVINDLQFGSTGKGNIAGYLAEHVQPDCIVTAWMPNAGHTYIDSTGHKFIHTMLANGVVSPKLKKIMVAPGSALNLDNLLAEIRALPPHLFKLVYERKIRIVVHEHAAVVLPRHQEVEEATMTGIGSTKKGCGEAIINKIQRPSFVGKANTVKAVMDMDYGPKGGIHDVYQFLSIVDQYNWLSELASANLIQVEGAQGYSLGINSGMYPYTTSRECTVAQILSDCCIPLQYYTCSIGAMRTFPIRVANRYDEDGKQVGWSGPCYHDQEELCWQKDLNLEPELTTVTQLPRRIFSFSETQIRQAILQNGTNFLFCNFMNYLTTGKHSLEYHSSMLNILNDCDVRIMATGWGAYHKDIRNEAGMVDFLEMIND